MNTNEKISDWMERQIEGSLTRDDQRLLSDMLEKDVSLQHEFLIRKEVEKLFQDKELFELRERLNHAYEVSTLEHDERQKQRHRFYYYAAAITGITLGGVVTYSLIHGNRDAVKLYAENFKPYPAYNTYRSGNQAPLDTLLFNAMFYYQNKDYPSAIKEFEALLKKESSNLAVRFYLGVSCMEVGQFEEARTNLKMVAESVSLFREQAQWYIALTYLGENKTEEAKVALISIAQGKTSLHQKALEILNKIEN